MNIEELKESLKGSMYEGRIKDIAGLDDEIEFECIRCGQCCTNRSFDGEPILVSPLDIYNGCKELNITPEEFVRKYTQENIGPTSGMVIMSLAVKNNGDCKLLRYDENGLAKCKIHKAKPTICAIHPLGIIHGGSKNDANAIKEKFYVVAEHCSNSQHGVMTKVKDIVDSVKGTDEEVDMAMELRTAWYPGMTLKEDLEHVMLHSVLMTGLLTQEERKELGFSDQFYIAARNITEMFTKDIGPLDVEKVDHEVLELDAVMPELIKGMNRKYTYLNYDLSRPFMEQAKENLETLTKFGKDMKEAATITWEQVTGKLNKKQLKKLDQFIKIYPILMSQMTMTK